jgi:hypothetical protein
MRRWQLHKDWVHWNANDFGLTLIVLLLFDLLGECDNASRWLDRPSLRLPAVSLEYITSSRVMAISTWSILFTTMNLAIKGFVARRHLIMSMISYRISSSSLCEMRFESHALANISTRHVISVSPNSTLLISSCSKSLQGLRKLRRHLSSLKYSVSNLTREPQPNNLLRYI